MNKRQLNFQSNGDGQYTIIFKIVDLLIKSIQKQTRNSLNCY